VEVLNSTIFRKLKRLRDKIVKPSPASLQIKKVCILNVVRGLLEYVVLQGGM